MSEKDFISKTRRKQQMHELQALGEELVRLKAAQLDRLELPEALLEAVLEARRMSKHEALRRQLQYIGRLMREVEAEPIRSQLDALRGLSARHTALAHLAERWRERLIASDAAFTDFAGRFPQADIARLRTLARAARQEQNENKPPHSFRLLFREIHLLVQAAAKSTNGETEC